MSDDSYRLERKKIDPADFGSQPNQVTPDQVSSFQNLSNKPENINQSQPVIKPIPGVNVSGNMPPAMQQLFQQRLAEAESDDGVAPVQNFNQNRNAPMNFSPMPTMAVGQGMNTNDPALSELLNGLSTQIYETVYLPSRGKFYQGGDLPTTGELHLRPMTGAEESILGTGRLMKKNGIEMILQACIKERINVRKMLSVDKTFLLIYLRAISYGNLYEASSKCDNCGQTFDHEIDLNLPVDYCPDDFTEDKLIKTLPSSGYKFQYRFQNGTDEDDIAAYEERKSKFSGNVVNDTHLFKFSVLTDWISNGNVQVNNRYAIQSLLEKLSSADVNYMRNVISEVPFGPNTELNLDCTNCGHTFTTGVPYNANFFFPRVKIEN